MSGSRQEGWAEGLRAGIPVVLGFVPVGIAYAIMARQAGFTIGQTVGMSAFVYAGASQMMAVGMFGQGAGLGAVVLAAFLLNLRHFMMSACVMNRLRNAPAGAKLPAAFFVTDESFAIFTTGKSGPGSVRYFFGLGLVTYAAWVFGSAVGAVSTALLPESLSASLGVALYAMFLALLLPNLRGNGRLALLVLFTAGLNALLGLALPASWAMILSTLAGAGLGVPFVPLEDAS